MAPAADQSVKLDSGAECRRFRLVALRCDSLGGAGGKSAGLGQRDVHSRRADVRENLAYAQKVKMALENGASPGISRAKIMKPTGRIALPWTI
jgi:hypothetical protein